MIIALLLQGILLGLSIAAPVGPIGVLCIQRTSEHGWRYGIISGLGAASADAGYGAIAALGLTFITKLLMQQHVWIQLIGGSFLIYLGWRTLWHSQATIVVAMAPPPQKMRLISAYTSTLFLTLINPTTILSFLAIFASVRLDTGGQLLPPLLIIVGIFSGSMLWWVLLTSGVNQLRTRFTAQTRAWINRLSGSVIVLFGVMTVFRALTPS